MDSGIPFKNLLDELKNYSPPGFMRRRAERIANLCVEHGHIAWAVRILQKNWGFPYQSDSSVALGFTLINQPHEEFKTRR